MQVESRLAALRRLILRCLCLSALAAAQAHAVDRISCDELRRLQLNRGSLTVVDVRDGADYAASHIQGAIHVPAGLIASAKLASDGPLVLYCAEHPCALSETAAEALTRSGRTGVRVLDGGLGEWSRKGYPVIAGAMIISAARPGRISLKEARRRLGEFTVID